MSDRPLPWFQLSALQLPIRTGNPGASPERSEPAKPAEKPQPKLSARSDDSADRPQAPYSPVSPDRVGGRISRSQSRAYAEQLKHLSEHDNWEMLDTSPRTRSEGYARQKPKPNPDSIRPRSERDVSSRSKFSSFISVGDVGGKKRAHSNSPRPNPEPGKTAGAHVSKKQRTSQAAPTESSRKPANVTASIAPAAIKKYSDQLKENFKELHQQIPGVCDQKFLSQLKCDLKSLTKQLQQDGDASAANRSIDALREKLTQLKEAAKQRNDTYTLEASSRLINLSRRTLDKLHLPIHAPDQTDTAHADQATASGKPRPGLGTIGPRKGSMLAPILRGIQGRRGAPAITPEPTPTAVNSSTAQPRHMHGSNLSSSMASDPSLSPDSMDKLCKEFFNDDEEALQSSAQEALDRLRGMDESEGNSSELISNAEKKKISWDLDEVLSRNLIDKPLASPPVEKHSPDDFERITPPVTPYALAPQSPDNAI